MLWCVIVHDPQLADRKTPAFWIFTQPIYAIDAARVTLSLSINTIDVTRE